MRLVGHISLIEGMRIACKGLLRKPELMWTWKFGIYTLFFILGVSFMTPFQRPDLSPS